MTATGRHSIQNALARARSAFTNHRASKTRVAGQTPPSATPSIKRKTQSSCQFRAKPHAVAQSPHATNKMATSHSLPPAGQVPSGNLKQHVAPEENPSHLAGLRRLIGRSELDSGES